VCKDLQEQLNNDSNFLCKTATGDKTWICGSDPEIEQQFSLLKSPSPQPKDAAGQVNSIFDIMLTVFFDSEEILHKEFVLQGQTVNPRFCVGFRKARDRGYKEKMARQLAHSGLVITC
jgi:hypothetical protein